VIGHLSGQAIDTIGQLAFNFVSNGIPDPGAGEAPPGSAGVLTILRWGAWIVFAVCVGGALFAGGTMAISRRRGEGGEHLTNLGWVLAGAIVAGSASGFVAGVL
jgi:hypothetical protein